MTRLTSQTSWLLARFLLPVTTVLLLCCLPAFAQSCALCYTQAASSGAKMIDALRNGILILVIPPTLASVGIVGICYRKRNQYQRRDAIEHDSNW